MGGLVQPFACADLVCGRLGESTISLRRRLEVEAVHGTNPQQANDEENAGNGPEKREEIKDPP
jgi:hypothetical protein